jgi:hypothetical protein
LEGMGLPEWLFLLKNPFLIASFQIFDFNIFFNFIEKEKVINGVKIFNFGCLGWE